MELTFFPEEFVVPASAGMMVDRIAGTNRPYFVAVAGDAADSSVYVEFRLPASIGAGNWTATPGWCADTATTGTLGAEVSVAAITPNTDTADIDVKAFDTLATGSDAHLGTTAGRFHEFDITLSDIDDADAGDLVTLKLTRDVSVGSNISGDVFFKYLTITIPDP